MCAGRCLCSLRCGERGQARPSTGSCRTHSWMRCAGIHRSMASSRFRAGVGAGGGAAHRSSERCRAGAAQCGSVRTTLCSIARALRAARWRRGRRARRCARSARVRASLRGSAARFGCRMPPAPMRSARCLRSWRRLGSMRIPILRCMRRLGMSVGGAHHAMGWGWRGGSPPSRRRPDGPASGGILHDGQRSRGGSSHGAWWSRRSALRARRLRCTLRSMACPAQ